MMTTWSSIIGRSNLSTGWKTMKASDASISDLIAFAKIAMIIPLSSHLFVSFFYKLLSTSCQNSLSAKGTWSRLCVPSPSSCSSCLSSVSLCVSLQPCHLLGAFTMGLEIATRWVVKVHWASCLKGVLSFQSLPDYSFFVKGLCFIQFWLHHSLK